MSKARKLPFTIAKDETIVAAVPELCNGPGWRNTPIWVYVLSSDGDIRSECIQPDYQTNTMLDLFKMVAIGQGQMKREIARVFGGKAPLNV